MSDQQSSSLDLQPRDVQLVRIRLGAERPAPRPDPLGRTTIGYADDLAPAELWRRGRGVWKAKLATLSECELAALVVEDVVQLVGTVEGVRFHEDRVSIDGVPLPDHPLVGRPDPLTNKSRNPIAYGTVRTIPGRRPAQRDRAEVFADAAAVMTEAARLRRRTLRPVTGADGAVQRWEPDPRQTEPADWAEFVTEVLAAAAANIGGIEESLAGRPGSWEADHVRQMLFSTVGEEQDRLWRHRTEPVRIVLSPDLDWLEQLYVESSDAIDALADAVTAEFETAPLTWRYRRTSTEWTEGVGYTADFVCDDPAAPDWPAALARYKDDLRAFGAGEDFIEMLPAPATTVEVQVSKSDTDRAEMVRLNALADEAAAPYWRLDEILWEQHKREVAEYGDRLTAAILAEAGRRYPGLEVEVRVVGPGEPLPADYTHVDDYPLDSPDEHLVRHALEHTPLPNSGRPLADYSAEQRYDLAAAEKQAGRLPHLRLDGLPTAGHDRE